jgi:hypothetical protein
LPRVKIAEVAVVAHFDFLATKRAQCRSTIGKTTLGGLMKSTVIHIAVLVLVSAVIAGAASISPLSTSSTDTANDPWHVTALPAGGKSMDVSQAILWNSRTGETWIWTGSGRIEWTPMPHTPRQ